MRTIILFLFSIISIVGNSQYTIYAIPNSNEITITLGQNLNFGSLYKGTTDSINVLISDTRTAWVKITAPKNKTIGISLSIPNHLNLNYNTIPVRILSSYSNSANNNSGNISTIKNSSSQIPFGINYIEIPVSSKQNNNKVYSDVYLFFYGTVSPIPLNVPSGTYDGIILLVINLID